MRHIHARRYFSRIIIPPAVIAEMLSTAATVSEAECETDTATESATVMALGLFLAADKLLAAVSIACSESDSVYRVAGAIASATGTASETCRCINCICNAESVMDSPSEIDLDSFTEIPSEIGKVSESDHEIEVEIASLNAAASVIGRNTPGED